MYNHRHEKKPDESLKEWINRISNKPHRWIDVIRLNHLNRKLRFGFGYHEGDFYARLDLWWIGFRINFN